MTATSDQRQQRPGLWQTVNERYPGSMISKTDTVPLAPLRRPLPEARLAFVSTAGVQPRGTLPFDVVHPVGDYTFRAVPSNSTPADLEIHQLKYPTDGAHRDLNVIFLSHVHDRCTCRPRGARQPALLDVRPAFVHTF